jgi:site-specific recombinase XerD
MVSFRTGDSTPHLSLSPHPAFARIKSLVLDSVPSPHSRRAYDRSLNDFLGWYVTAGSGQGLTKATVQRYARHLDEQGLAASTRNVRLTAVRRLAAEAADNGLLDPALAAGIGRVKGAKQQGTRTGNWLTVDQAEQLINAPDISRLKGKRDRALRADRLRTPAQRNFSRNLHTLHS